MNASKLQRVSCCAMVALLAACSKPAPDAPAPSSAASAPVLAPASAAVAAELANGEAAKADANPNPDAANAERTSAAANKLTLAWVEAGAGLHALSASCGRLDAAKIAQARSHMKTGLVGEGPGKLSANRFDTSYQNAYDTTTSRIVQEPAKAKLGCAQLNEIEDRARQASKQMGLPAPL